MRASLAIPNTEASILSCEQPPRAECSRGPEASFDRRAGFAPQPLFAPLHQGTATRRGMWPELAFIVGRGFALQPRFARLYKEKTH